jgi:adenosylcobinamide kinase/adenosylcobinamide-phosphate guanylyltransferase
MGKLTLILGGARSGKSTYAEQLASQGGKQVTYIATAQGLDSEMTARIVAHQRKRPSTWETLEIPYDVANDFQARQTRTHPDIVLLDCLTLLVSNLVMRASTDVDAPDERLATDLVASEIKNLLAIIRDLHPDWIIVSNEVGMGLVPPYPLGRIYRDLLGSANQRLAAVADEVYFMIAGIPMRLMPLDHNHSIP